MLLHFAQTSWESGVWNVYSAHLLDQHIVLNSSVSSKSTDNGLFIFKFVFNLYASLILNWNWICSKSGYNFTYLICQLVTHVLIYQYILLNLAFCFFVAIRLLQTCLSLTLLFHLLQKSFDVYWPSKLVNYLLTSFFVSNILLNLYR